MALALALLALALASWRFLQVALNAAVAGSKTFITLVNVTAVSGASIMIDRFAARVVLERWAQRFWSLWAVAPVVRVLDVDNPVLAISRIARFLC